MWGVPSISGSGMGHGMSLLNTPPTPPRPPPTTPAHRSDLFWARSVPMGCSLVCRSSGSWASPPVLPEDAVWVGDAGLEEWGDARGEVLSWLGPPLFLNAAFPPTDAGMVAKGGGLRGISPLIISFNVLGSERDASMPVGNCPIPPKAEPSEGVTVGAPFWKAAS